MLIALLSGSAVAGVWWCLRGRPAPEVAPPAANQPDDPRLTFDTRYRNVRPGVGYVGDAECSRCHASLSKSYRQHPMGRSLAPAPGPRGAEHLGEGGRAAFEALGLGYVAERRGDRLFHRETVSGPGGEVVAAVEAEVGYVIGSGRRGAGYLVVEDGYVFQSPISWYPQKGVWDLSPGYRERNEHFDRPVTAECLFCHSNRVEPVEHTANRYQVPVFRGAAIGCERCHGPGELHVREQEKPDEPAEDADTIVNPRRLEPALREAVCEQCHLQGQARVLRRGRGVFDYRPGLPLDLFWSVFVFPPGAVADPKAVGQVEQMHQSRCYQASAGDLGCTSCHDPHRLPPAAEKTAFYRGRCLDCHRTRAGCSLPAPARRAWGDDCVACHMPQLSATDIAHVAATDHRILRDPEHEPRQADPAGAPRGPPLLSFRGRAGPGRGRDDGRDLGVALTDLADQAPPGAVRVHFSQAALPLLEEATWAAPDDVRAWEARAVALRSLHQPREALEACEKALALTPRREVALAEAATAAGQLGRAEDAMDHWRRAVAVSPRRWRYHYELGQLLWDRRRWADALAELDTALRLNPADVNARILQVACLINNGQEDQARAAFARLMALKPPREEELRRWFTSRLP
ncbi:MAG TPA: tetratricopeptide repeat protein [Gemmataceae bacterium]|nr:tetratricopeptide repeat protein [Gemmataceae bacterium]